MFGAMNANARYWNSVEHDALRELDAAKRLSEVKLALSTMRVWWVALAPMLLLMGCAHHTAAWDDAWAACQAEAIEQMEFAGVDGDQRSEWQENYIAECMDRKGFKEKRWLIE
jgi:hypothetical protein